jgi:hypothetical protein
MSNTVTIGKRLIALDHIALVEPFDPAAHPGMKTDKLFKARVVLIDRQSVLAEEAPAHFVESFGFRMLSDEGVATNPGFRFSVESFEPVPGFEPTKPYLTRISWRDLDGETQSKLLLSAPETVLAIAVKGEGQGIAKPTVPSAGGGRKPTSSSDRRKARRRHPEPAPL